MLTRQLIISRVSSLCIHGQSLTSPKQRWYRVFTRCFICWMRQGPSIIQCTAPTAFPIPPELCLPLLSLCPPLLRSSVLLGTSFQLQLFVFLHNLLLQLVTMSTSSLLRVQDYVSKLSVKHLLQLSAFRH